MRTTVSCKSRIAHILFGLVIAGTPVAAQSAQSPPKALLEYVQKAKAQGVTDSRIRHAAVAAGWAPSVVNSALATAKGDTSPSSPNAGAETPAETQPALPDTAVPIRAYSSSASASAAGATAAGSEPKQRLSVNFPGGDYQIGAGDVLQVSVWKAPEISVPSVTVRPDGMITIPLIKDVRVAQLTPRQAEDVITEGLAKYIVDPNVTVVVAASNSKKIYVMGAIKAEGIIPYRYRMTVMQAIGEAGGLGEYARRKKIYILRKQAGEEYRLDFNYEEVIKGFKMEQDIELLPGDMIVIPD